MRVPSIRTRQGASAALHGRHGGSRLRVAGAACCSQGQKQLQTARQAAQWQHGAPAPLHRAVLVAAVQALAVLQLAVGAAWADDGSFTIDSRPAEGDVEDQYFQTVPQGLDSADSKAPVRLGRLLDGPKGKQVQQCARKCVPTCIRGGQGAPGLGPMSVRKEIVVFKDGYRSRSYCLTECITVCALEIDPPATAAPSGGGAAAGGGSP